MMASRRKRRSAKWDGGPCHWCRRQMRSTTDQSELGATRDHIHPKHLGGTSKVWSCRACNNIKGGMTEDEWSDFMKANPNWWESYDPRTNYMLKQNETGE